MEHSRVNFDSRCPRITVFQALVVPQKQISYSFQCHDGLEPFSVKHVEWRLFVEAP
jgi:hypothetical protein